MNDIYFTGVVPIGMRADAKESSEMQGLPMIGRHAVSKSFSFDNLNVLVTTRLYLFLGYEHTYDDTRRCAEHNR